jgi:DNA processing protein
LKRGSRAGRCHKGWEALRLNRPLFILKSVFENSNLTWPGDMQEYGAQVLEDLDQILDVLPIGLPPLEEVAF